MIIVVQTVPSRMMEKVQTFMHLTQKPSLSEKMRLLFLPLEKKKHLPQELHHLLVLHAFHEKDIVVVSLFPHLIFVQEPSSDNPLYHTTTPFFYLPRSVSDPSSRHDDHGFLFRLEKHWSFMDPKHWILKRRHQPGDLPPGLWMTQLWKNDGILYPHLITDGSVFRVRDEVPCFLSSNRMDVRLDQQQPYALSSISPSLIRIFSSVLPDIMIVCGSSRRGYIEKWKRQQGFGHARLMDAIIWKDGSFRGLRAGEIGCFLSHLSVWERYFHATTPVLILEDDVCSSNHLKETWVGTALMGLLHHLEQLVEQWDIAYLGRCWDDCRSSTAMSPLVSRVFSPFCSHAYLLAPGSIQKIFPTKEDLLRYKKEIRLPFDHFMQKQIHQKTWVAVTPTSPPVFFDQNPHLQSGINNPWDQMLRKGFDLPICKEGILGTAFLIALLLIATVILAVGIGLTVRK